MPHLDLDIETIPSQAPGAREHIAADIRQPATMSKADTIAAWERDKKPETVETAYRKTALDGGWGHVVSMSWGWDEGEIEGVEGMPWMPPSAPSGDASEYRSFLAEERDYLDVALRAIEARVERRYPVVSGHCVNFDIRFIAQRAMVLGVRLPVWWPHNARPWDEARILCTSARWTGSERERISLDELCRILGIEGKGDVDGSKVYDLWLAGDHRTISAYCGADVARARACRRRLMFVDVQVVSAPPAQVYDEQSGEIVATDIDASNAEVDAELEAAMPREPV